MIHQDQVEVEKLNAKNTLEEFIYEMKNKSDTTLSDFMSEEVSSFAVQSKQFNSKKNTLNCSPFYAFIPS